MILPGYSTINSTFSVHYSNPGDAYLQKHGALLIKANYFFHQINERMNETKIKKKIEKRKKEGKKEKEEERQKERKKERERGERET